MLRYTSPAIADLDEIWLWIAGDSPTNADLFVDRIRKSASGWSGFHGRVGQGPNLVKNCGVSRSATF